MSKIYLLLLVFVCSFLPTKAQTLKDTTFEVHIPYQNLDIIDHAIFPQFNPAWGQLQSVQLGLHALLTIIDSVENYSPNPRYLSVTFLDSIFIKDINTNSGTFCTGMSGIAIDSIFLAANDGIMGTGNDMTTDTVLAADIQHDTLFTNSTLLTQYIGLGTIEDSILVIGWVDVVPSGSIMAYILSNMELFLTLRYIYLTNPVGIVEGMKPVPLQIFPNPSRGLTKIYFEEEIAQYQNIAIYNTNGVLVFSHSIAAIQGKNEYFLPTYSFAQGIYYVKIGAQGAKLYVE
jgi:hypothetical protein